MPTIKLTAGTLRRGAERFVAGDVLDVTDKLAAVLDCEIVEPAKPKEPEHDLESLRTEALVLGIDYKKQWSADKLLKEIANHGHAGSE